MNSDSKRLFDIRPAVGARLGCAFGVDFLVPSPSVFSFGFEYFKEQAPCGVGYPLGQVSVSNHSLNVEFLNGEIIIALHKLMGELMAKVKPLVRDFFVNMAEQNAGFVSTVGSPFSAGEPPICSSKHSFGFPEIFGSIYLLPVACGYERIESHVNADLSASLWKQLGLAFHEKGDMPFTVPPGDIKSLDFATDWPVPFDFHKTGILKIKTPFFNLASIADGSVEYCVEPMGTFEPRISRLLAPLHPTEERLERFVQPAERLLEGAIIAERYVFAFFSQFWGKISRLCIIGNPFPCFFVNILSLLKSLIVEKAVTAKLCCERLYLLFCGIKAIFVRFNHLFCFLFPVPIRTFAGRADSHFRLSRNPLVAAARANKIADFYVHIYKYTLYSAKNQHNKKEM